MKFCPAQIEPEFTIIIGLAFTIKLLVATACDTQPAVLVPATVKLELLNGLTTAFPPCMVYVFAPLGLMVKFCPAQIAPEFTIIVGLVFTIKLLVATACDTHPVTEFVPITVKDVLLVGLTTRFPP